MNPLGIRRRLEEGKVFSKSPSKAKPGQKLPKKGYKQEILPKNGQNWTFEKNCSEGGKSKFSVGSPATKKAAASKDEHKRKTAAAEEAEQPVSEGKTSGKERKK